MTRRIVCASMIFVLSLALWLPFHAMAQERERKTGEWQQFVWSDGRWRALGAFVVEQQNGVYLMKRVERGDVGPGVVKSRGLFDIQFTDSEWIFKSDWGSGRFGTFRLSRIGPGIYQGWSYEGDKQLERNLWLLMK